MWDPTPQSGAKLLKGALLWASLLGRSRGRADSGLREGWRQRVGWRLGWAIGPCYLLTASGAAG